MGEADFCVLRWQWAMIITKEIIKATSKGSKIYLPITVACMKRNGLDALNFQYKMNYNRSTNFEYTTETIMFYTRC